MTHKQQRAELFMADQRTEHLKEIYFIGFNDRYKLGLNHNNALNALSKCPNPLITTVFCASGYHLYCDDNYETIWSAGVNTRGSCAHEFCHYIKKYKEIKYFKNNNIKIQKICVSLYSWTTFFIDTQNKLYGVGENTFGQLGIKDNFENQCKPVLIDQLKNVIDVCSNRANSFALCENIKKDIIIIILKNWCRNIDFVFPYVMIELIILFTKSINVYKTSSRKYGWKEMEVFADVEISKIASGVDYSLFLDINGNVWVSGYNSNDCLGFNDDRYKVKIPEKLPYFVDKNIKICDICCGCMHNMVLDNNGKVYCWGDNKCGQCGDGTIINILSPKPIEYFEHKPIAKIGCGSRHSYFESTNGQSWICGSNTYGQCLCSDVQYVLIPKQLDIKGITNVFFGYGSTALQITNTNKLCNEGRNIINGDHQQKKEKWINS